MGSGFMCLHARCEEVGYERRRSGDSRRTRVPDMRGLRAKTPRPRRLLDVLMVMRTPRVSGSRRGGRFESSASEEGGENEQDSEGWREGEVCEEAGGLSFDMLTRWSELWLNFV